MYTKLPGHWNEQFLRFLKAPDSESYLAVRAALVSSEHYDPYSDEMETIDEMLSSGKLAEAREMLLESMPNLFLSPRAHMTLSYIAENASDDEGAQMEGFIAATCAKAILATGDGSKENPYIVVRTSDEHDVVPLLGKQPRSQSLVRDGDRYLDVMRYNDGKEMYFDITDAFTTNSRRMRT